ncbi:hypothetical protein D3C72_2171970 [compost metagenome]
MGAFGHRAERLHPAGLGLISGRIGLAAIDGLTPHAGNLANIGRAALAAFNLHRSDIGSQQFRQQFQRIEAGGFFQRVVAHVIHQIAALAQRRVTSIFIVPVAVDQHAVQA